MKIISILKPSIKIVLQLILWMALSNAHAANAAVSLTNTTSTDFLPVEQAYQAAVFSDNGEIIVDLQMAQGYYLYKHAFALQVNKQTLEFSYSNEGIDRDDEYFGAVTVFYDNLQLIGAHSDAKQLTLRSQGCADAGLCYPPRTQHFYFDSNSNSWIEDQATVKNAVEESPRTPVTPLLKLLLFAFLGGLILNLMPCVLPVLTLKALSFAKQKNRQARIKQGWAYTAGVILSFSAIAATLIALKASGQAIGWGFQLQSPFVITILVYIFFVMALSLLGAFNLFGPVISSNDAGNDSLLQSFSTGALACIVASPCTAPFMGTAIGTALTLNTLPALLIFISLGAGMAVPFLLLSYAPSTGRFLPKPGAWMNTLKELLAFPLLATCIWLISIASQQSGTNGVIALLSGCMFLAFITWWRKSLSLVSITALIILVTALSTQLKPSPVPSRQAFSLTELDSLIQREGSVFVNVTASWCITCKANEMVLKKDSVQRLFTTTNTHYVEADWTRPNIDITKLLARHQRNGIPLYLHYTDGNITTPDVLPQFLNETILQASFKK